MFGAKWLKGGRQDAAAVPPKAEAEAAPAAVPIAAVAPPPAAAVPSDAPAPEPARADAAPEAAKPAAAAAADAVRRASRMVEVTRSRSSRLGRDMRAAFAKHGTWHKPAAAAALALAIGGVGYAAGRVTGPSGQAARLAAVMTEIDESRTESARMAAELKSVRATVETIRTEREKATNRQSQLTERVDRSASDTSGRIGKLAEQLERIEKMQRDPNRLAPLTERLDRLERGLQVASAPAAPAVAVQTPTATPSSAAPVPPPKPVAALDVATTGSIDKADARRQPVDGYVLRDIDDGLALIEARNGRYFEVSPGMTVPGLGRVEAIERRGRQWVVVTSKGYIGGER